MNSRRQNRHGPARNHKPRRGASVVEMAVVAPLAFLLTIGVIVGGMGVFRYNQVAGLAREGARWASVRGREYQNNAHRSRVTSEDVVSEVIRKKSVALDPKRLQCEVTWGPNDTTVSVTLRYEWIPGVSGQGGVFQSTAVMFVSY